MSKSMLSRSCFLVRLLGYDNSTSVACVYKVTMKAADGYKLACIKRRFSSCKKHYHIEGGELRIKNREMSTAKKEHRAAN